jgi:hypothetical protein
MSIWDQANPLQLLSVPYGAGVMVGKRPLWRAARPTTEAEASINSVVLFVSSLVVFVLAESYFLLPDLFPPQ